MITEGLTLSRLRAVVREFTERNSKTEGRIVLHLVDGNQSLWDYALIPKEAGMPSLEINSPSDGAIVNLQYVTFVTIT